VHRYVARLVTQLVSLLVVDYSTSRRLVVDYVPPPRVRVPRHVAPLVTRLVAPLVIDYSTSRRLVVDYFDSAARPVASVYRAARHAACRAARRRLLHLA
jgi:hypothetical protein